MRIHGKPPGRGEQHPASGIAPGTRERRQRGNRAHRIGSPAGTLNAVIDPNSSGANRAPSAGQPDNIRFGQPTNLGRARRWPLQRTLRKRLEPFGMLFDPRVIEQIFRNQHMNQRECQGRIRART